MSTPTSYSKTQITLHWVIAILVILQVAFHEPIVELWDARMTGEIPNESTPHPHAIMGGLILVLALWRLWIRMKRGVPAPPEGENPILVKIAAATHWLFYALLIGMPISGAIAWFGGIEPAAGAHALSKMVLIPLIGLHFCAALAQHFWFKTNVLKRMVGKA